MTDYSPDTLGLYLEHCKSVIMEEASTLLNSAPAGATEEMKKALTIMSIGTFVYSATSLMAAHSTQEKARELLQGVLKSLDKAMELERDGIKKSDSPWGQVR